MQTVCDEHGRRLPALSSWPVPHHPCTLSPVSHAWLVFLKRSLLVRDHIWCMQREGRHNTAGEEERTKGHQLWGRARSYLLCTKWENILGSEDFSKNFLLLKAMNICPIIISAGQNPYISDNSHVFLGYIIWPLMYC